jgi:hypothetical protein
VAKEITIPKPTATQLEALRKAKAAVSPSTGRGAAIAPKKSKPQLVWSTNSNTWKVLTEEKMNLNDVTYFDWQNGRKKIQLNEDESEAVSKQLRSDDGGVPYYNRPGRREGDLQSVIDENNIAITVDPDDGKAVVKSNGKQVWIYLDSGSKDYEVTTDYDKVKKAVLLDLKSADTLNQLFDELYAKKQISKATYESKNTTADDFNARLVGILNQYSKEIVEGNEDSGGSYQPPSLIDYAKGLLVGLGGEKQPLPRREFQDISKVELNAFIDQIYVETIGRKPSEEQRSAKLKELNKIVKEGILTTQKKVGGEIQSRTTGGFDQQEQQLKLEGKLKTENPLEYERRQAFDFMGQLQKILSGGM